MNTPELLQALEDAEAELSTLLDLFTRSRRLGSDAFIMQLACRVPFIGSTVRKSRAAITSAKSIDTSPQV